jgi:acetylornithine/N-succinyldiaminopimelate aminotransferase
VRHRHRDRAVTSPNARLLTGAVDLFPNYRQFPLVLVRGEGSRVWDADGREYADFVAGIATCNLGHCHPAVTEAIRRQAGELVHCSNWYFNQPNLALARLLTEITFADRVFFCNSGAEASEAAIKLSRKRASDRFGAGRETVVSLLGAFHGRTMKALAATDPRHHLPAFAPYPGGFVHLAPGDLAGLAQALPRACMLLAEPVQGEGGVRPLDPAFLEEAAALCRRHDVLLAFDEVQTGVGRCGTPFAYQALGIEPDLLTCAKALGNGFPIGALLAREEAASHLGPGTHGSTFGGNPLASAAALATVETMMREDLPARAARMGEDLMARLRALSSRHPLIKEVRGMGLLIGVELAVPAALLAAALLAEGYLATVVRDTTIRLTPPLNVPGALVDGLLAAFDRVLSAAEEGAVR